ncbi:MAG TPA: asparagine synthase (glutamine-hydrolyzing) [Frankiaceae bacterium]|nr:asparagine synthase (glutamine-hydrolyzing) [Frankiaceae bacterium]
MCGIVVDFQAGAAEPDPEMGPRMLARVRARGPDGSGSATVRGTWLGHTRLSIVDVVGGKQPLRDVAGQHWLVCNGEIYNHEDLRRQLPRFFGTGSDSEAALAVLDARGLAGIADLRGMFAFCIADDHGGLVAARDPVGIKPLYWARRGNRVLFASELGAFDAGWRADVEAFPPAHYWTSDTGLTRFAELENDEPDYASRDEARAAVSTALTDAVRRQLMSDDDVGVGVFLSGGLDSNLIAAVAAVSAREAGTRLHTFTAGVEGSPDLLAARDVAAYLQTEHHERIYTAQEAIDALPEVVESIESYEPSLVRSAVPNYLLAQLAVEHVKVVLTGEGADELFAGYDHLREISDPDELRSELVRSVEGLHNLNLQRCDRVTMAHGLEARVPFLDLDMIHVAQRVPIAWKLPGAEGQEKRLLREAFAGQLPPEFLSRPKAQFGDGSGTTAVMSEAAGQLAPDLDWRSARVSGLPRPRSREELGYQRIFASRLAGIHPSVLGRFATG